VLPIAFCLAAVVLALHPTVQSGLRLVQTDLGDTRLNMYLLEHSYRWVRGEPTHADFWSPPFFYPSRNTAAYTDLLLGAAPLFWAWRLLGAEPDTAFQLWTGSALGLNFLLGFLLLRRHFGLGILAASGGANLLAAGAPLVAQLNHVQLIPLFFPLGLLFSLLQLFQRYRAGLTGRRDGLLIGLATGCLVAQTYTGFYLAWYVLLSGLVALGWTLLVPSWRSVLLSFIQRHWLALGLAAASAIVALLPLAIHYLEAADQVGLRDYKEIRSYLPLPQAWLLLAPDSWFYRWQTTVPLFRSVTEVGESRLGVGLLTTALVLAGLALGWRRTAVRLLLLVALTLILLVTMLPGGFSLWQFVHAWVPGAQAIRAVGRIGLLLLIPAAIGLAFLLESLQRRRLGWLALALAALCLLEQGRTTASYDKLRVRQEVAQIQAGIPAGCEAFLFTPVSRDGDAPFPLWKYQVDAMWAELGSGVPTLNGQSGDNPPDWPFKKILIDSRSDEARLREGLAAWAQQTGLPAEQLCQVRVEVDGSRRR
jgi:hypothetical protein